MDALNNANSPRRNLTWQTGAVHELIAFEQPLRDLPQEREQQAEVGPSRPVVSAADQRFNTAAQQPHRSLIAISNRGATVNSDQPKTGGLSAALECVVERSGAVWVGFSEHLGDGDTQQVPLVQRGKGQIGWLDGPAADYSRYYQGFANSILWPALHSLPDRISGSEEDYKSYRDVNAFMARAVSELGDNAVYWVHDYHFLPLGADLHRLGIDRPIGHFLHTPWPESDMMERVPNSGELMKCMLEYDLLGFQTDRDVSNFLACVQSHLGLESKNGVVFSDHGQTQCQNFPIGIDPKQFEQCAADSLEAQKAYISQLKLGGAKLVIGVDRLDYTKGIDNRIKAFDLLAVEPQRVSLLQIATPSRGDIQAYSEYRRDVERLVNQVNNRHGTDEWMPIIYENRSFTQAEIAGLYRAARVCVVTPLRDGMNLVAKEYIAAQDPSDPGVLVLSKFAGAAEDFGEDALLVNPRLSDEIATAISRAASMPREERIQRWRRMMDKLEAYTIHHWSADFVRQLDSSRVTVPADHFHYVGLGWISEAQMPSYRTEPELHTALTRALDKNWVLPIV
ncbi:trehalose-6-phosphate synthase [Mesorhizobium sp. M0496]|uniref:alpha,alpha-trehalose-phosphate synthase (UDP-forming) n=1 Tax=Mesorhizobium sp. M0496 TaxID=2956952 RepID=UPI00333CC52A